VIKLVRISRDPSKIVSSIFFNDLSCLSQNYDSFCMVVPSVLAVKTLSFDDLCQVENYYTFDRIFLNNP
jgi:hypothetical protein